MTRPRGYNNVLKLGGAILGTYVILGAGFAAMKSDNVDAPSGAIESIESKIYHNDMWSSHFFEVKLTGHEKAFSVGDTTGIECGDSVYIDKRIIGRDRAIKK